MSTDHVAALKGMMLCRTLSPAELEVIASVVEPREIGAGKELFREGETGDGLFLVLAGEINVIKSGLRGERSLARLGPGGVLGEMSLITADARSATGRASVDSQVLRLPAERFRALMAEGSTAALKIAAAISEVLARRLAVMNNMVLKLADRVDPGAATLPGIREKELAELHRTIQVWSF
jgi:CRP-like cAMP-binding protein